MGNSKKMSSSDHSTPLVAVRILTYNHKKYVSQALDSVFKQKTNFHFIVVLSDDCSTDGTTDICSKYKRKYSNQIVLQITKRNNIKKNSKDNFEACIKSGAPYIALLEGDDYWTDPYKLQKQVDFLEKNPQYVICGHRNLKVNSENQIIGRPRELTKNSFSQADIANKNPLSTMTVLFKNKINQLPEWFYECPIADWALYMILTNYGDAWIMPDIMAAYRKHDDSLWTGANQRKRFQLLINQLEIFCTVFPNYKNAFHRNQRRNLIGYLYWSKFNLFKMIRCLYLILTTSNSEIKLKDWIYKIKNPSSFNHLA